MAAPMLFVCSACKYSSIYIIIVRKQQGKTNCCRTKKDTQITLMFIVQEHFFKRKIGEIFLLGVFP